MCASTRSLTSLCVINVNLGLALLRWDAFRLHHRPTLILRMNGLSVSIYVGTRKMVNYA